MRKLVYKGAEDLCLRSLMCDKASANAGTRSHKWVWPLDCTNESVRVSRRGSLRDTLTSGKKIAQRVESSKLQGKAVDCCKSVQSTRSADFGRRTGWCQKTVLLWLCCATSHIGACDREDYRVVCALHGANVTRDSSHTAEGRELQFLFTRQGPGL
jgi:hypothetical protein